MNNFLVKAQWISAIPGMVFCVYAGPLSDHFGQKPLIMLPLIGYIFSSIAGFINYTFIDSIPLEFLYFETVYAFFGGIAVYYLGVYSYGSRVSKPEERAHRIARLDGVETLATVIGTLISPGTQLHSSDLVSSLLKLVTLLNEIKSFIYNDL